MPRKVTIAICTWNREVMLRRTLDQMMNLRVPDEVQWELLVVNNNCTDGTDAVVGAFGDRLPVRVIHEPTPGQARARNLAIAEAKGDYILWTDDDVLLDSNWLVAILQAFDRFDAEWVFGRSEPEWPGSQPPWYSEQFRGYFALLDYGPEPFVVTDVRKPFYGLNFACARSAVLGLNGFRSEFGFRGAGGGIGEDIDMFERAVGAGMRVVYTPHAVVRHIIPPDRLLKSYHRRRHWTANEVYYQFLDELYPQARTLLGLPRFFFGKAAGDGARYVANVAKRNRSEAFYYELQVLRFVRLLYEAGRHGFQRPSVQRADPQGTSPR
jgi:glycosyltransferase involved in cell wall biosynthesis